MGKKKVECFICAGYDPKCHCHQVRRLRKTVAAINQDRNRAEFLANVWVKCWKFNVTLIHPPRAYESQAREMFGPWKDRQGRLPVPEEVKKLVKIGF